MAIGYLRDHLCRISILQIIYSCEPDSIRIDIIMERGTFNEGANVKTKVNKGLFLWRKIVQNKSKNDKFRFKNFSYEVYNKLELDIKNLDFKKVSKFKPLKQVTDIINSNIDSTEGPPYLPAYLTETISDYYYQPKPLRRREVIKAVNTNGVKNESIIPFPWKYGSECKCVWEFYSCNE